MKITRRDIFTNKENTLDLDITEEQFNSWRNGEGCIQNIMPNLSKELREFLISGTMPESWDTHVKVLDK